MDDKGSTVIIVNGFPPYSHQDDAIRSVLTAINLRKQLKKINVKCNIGIATGPVFAGIVGTSGSRREYSTLADTVNLSARMMQAACYSKDKKILLCQNTKAEAEHKIAFRFCFK